jgi:hypothetical protein
VRPGEEIYLRRVYTELFVTCGVTVPEMSSWRYAMDAREMYDRMLEVFGHERNRMEVPREVLGWFGANEEVFLEPARWDVDHHIHVKKEEQ